MDTPTHPQKLSIIIPVFNEEASLEQVLVMLQQARFPVALEVLIVDDHSRDKTLAVAETLRRENPEWIKVLHNRINRGKGACIRQGLKHVSGEFVVVQDGDLEYDPRELPGLLEPLLEGRADVTYGSRFLKKGWPRGMALPNWVANRLLTQLFNVLYRNRLSDLMTCYKVMSTQVARTLKVHTDRFGFDPEMSAKIALSGYRIVELPISYKGRTHREGKKISWKDFFLIVALLFRIKKNPDLPLGSAAVRS